MEKLKIYMKLLNIMSEVDNIPKNGKNKSQDYRYATEADTADILRKAMINNKVIMIGNEVEKNVREHKTAKGNTMWITTVTMEYSLIDCESGERETFKMSGEGSDSLDKGLYKAITGSEKYALMKTFLVPTGDDAENDINENDKNSGKWQMSEAQRKRLFAKQKNAGVDEDRLKKHLKDSYGIESRNDLNKLQYDKLCNDLDRITEKGKKAS